MFGCFGIAAHADALQVVIQSLDRLQNVEGLAVLAHRLFAVTADDIEIIDTRRTQCRQESFQLGFVFDHPRRQVGNDPMPGFAGPNHMVEGAVQAELG